MTRRNMQQCKLRLQNYPETPTHPKASITVGSLQKEPLTKETNQGQPWRKKTNRSFRLWRTISKPQTTQLQECRCNHSLSMWRLGCCAGRSFRRHWSTMWPGLSIYMNHLPSSPQLVSRHSTVLSGRDSWRNRDRGRGRGCGAEGLNC